MSILARAKALEAQGRDVIHMEVGEPGFPMPEPLLAAARRALAAVSLGYTPSAGLPALREAVARHYAARYDIDLDPMRVLITPGGSGAVQLALASILETGDGVLVTEPGYPCHRHVATVVGARVDAMPVHAADGWRPTSALVAAHWRPATRVLMITTPGNPTGAVIGGATLAELYTAVRDRGGGLVVDETYQGLIYDAEDVTALACGDDGLFVVNSFSKYFGLTGWRLGWLVVPSGWTPVVERLAQNLYLAAPTLSQHLALAAFSDPVLRVLEARRQTLRRRRDLLLEALPRLGFGLPAVPDGAFYVFAALPQGVGDAAVFAEYLLDAAGVAVTPGADFGGADAAGMLRFAYTDEAARLRDALSRMGTLLATSRSGS
jgi:aspartate/methionine/tyrosine aminotransferase